ncbi:hypothetical protein EON68_04965, partial [archaeon]
MPSGSVALQDGSAYRTWVRATDAAGNREWFASNGFSVRTEPLEAHEVSVRVPEAVPSWRLVTASWSGFRSAVGIKSYAVSATFLGGRTPLQVGPINVGLATTLHQLSSWMPTLALRDFTTQYAAWEAGVPAGQRPSVLVTVTATALNGRTRSISSATASVIDATPLSVPLIMPISLTALNEWQARNGSAGASAWQPVASTNHASMYAFAWSALFPTGATYAAYASLGTSECAGDLVSGIPLALNASHITFTLPGIPDGTRLYAMLSLTSRAGVVSTSCSAPLLVDRQAPAAPSFVAFVSSVADDEEDATGAPSALYTSEPVIRAT